VGVGSHTSAQLAAALDGGRLSENKTIPWRYVGVAFGYVVAYVGAALAVALVL
jgi:hypothetical protein